MRKLLTPLVLQFGTGAVIGMLIGNVVKARDWFGLVLTVVGFICGWRYLTQ